MGAGLARALLAAVFLLSALLKAADFAATGALVSSVFGLGGTAARASLAALVLLEMGLAAALALRLRPERAVTLAALALLGGFAALAGWMMAQGMDNCGCFGTRFEMGPGATLAKNLALMAVAAVLLRRAGPAGPARLAEAAA